MRTRVKNLQEYLSFVGRIRKKWRIPRHDELWFRAEDSKNYATRLRPGLYRPNAAGARRRSISGLVTLEGELYEEFCRCATQLSSDFAQTRDDDWTPYFLMQHHGVPTRLLDWTDGALIALHFAIRGKSSRPDSGSIIYVLDPYWMIDRLDEHPESDEIERRWLKIIEVGGISKAERVNSEKLYLPRTTDKDGGSKLFRVPEIPTLWDSPHVSRRIAAQRSRFMIFGRDADFLLGMERVRESRLAGVEIPKGSVNRIRLELRDAGMSESVVFPDLDGLGRELKQDWENRR